MTTEEFAKVGMYIIALIAYLLGTGIVGVIGMFTSDDPDMFCISAWIYGALTFAAMVVYFEGVTP